jgi:TatD DNase family protein
MIDTHAHINTERFSEDREQMINRAKEAGLEHIIVPAIEPKDFDELLELVSGNSMLSCGIGIHPHNVSEVGQSELDLVEKLSFEKKVVAIGECGIDYYYDFAPKEKQKEIFDAQINIAKRRDLPVIVHNREADFDVLDIIKANQDGNLKGVLHCFSSDLATLKKTLDQGFLASFTGNITFKKSTLNELIEYIPLERIMIETDSPYMAPVPKRGKRNEPAFVRFVAEKIAEIKNIPLEKVIEMTSENAKKLFKLGLVIMFLGVFFLNTNPTFSQSAEEEEEYYYEDDEYYEDEYYEDSLETEKMLYPRLFGLGFFAGSATIVERRYRKEGDQPFTQNPQVAYGGELSVFLFEYLNLRSTFFYSENDKPIRDAEDLAERIPGLNIEYPVANEHYIYDIAASITPNPDSRVNFFLTLGLSYNLNNLSVIDKSVPGLTRFQKSQQTQFGFTYGLGVMGNIYFDNIGTLSIIGEVKFNNELDRYPAEVYDGVEKNSDGELIEKVITLDISNIYVTSRFGILFYPDF